MLGGGDENALLHQAGGVADASYVTSTGFDREAFQVGAMKHNSGPRRCRQNPQADGCAAVDAHSCARDRSTNCLLVCQREDSVSLLLCNSLPRWMDFRMWQNNHTPWFARPWQL